MLRVLEITVASIVALVFYGMVIMSAGIMLAFVYSHTLGG